LGWNNPERSIVMEDSASDASRRAAPAMENAGRHGAAPRSDRVNMASIETSDFFELDENKFRV
jgi:hypothetical protein